MSWLNPIFRLFRSGSAADTVAEATTDADAAKVARTWRLWQIEPTRACNLRCLMCPWHGLRGAAETGAYMSEDTWRRLAPHLRDVGSVDFTGSGEPLLHPSLFGWIEEAKRSGCTAGFLSNGLLLESRSINRVVDSGLDWLGFSVDGADRNTYEQIRRGSDFARVCANIGELSKARTHGRPFTMINFVILEVNCSQLADMVRLAGELGVDQVNFKQCDVIRGEYGKTLGLFGETETSRTRKLRNSLKQAQRLAERAGVETTSFAFTPKEQPVCDQDPRSSLFIRSDGTAAPCINLAYGGQTTFFAKDAVLPDLHFGTVNEQDIDAIWFSQACSDFRRRFELRTAQYDASLVAADFGHDLIKFNEAFAQAVRAMSPAPAGCRHCHYLYGV